MAQEKLAKILKKVNALPGLSADNIIGQIKTKLQEEDKETYEGWGKEDFHVDHPFTELIANNYVATTQNTLLNIAVANNCVNVVNALIEKGADVNKAPCEWTPLHFAVLNNHIDIVDILIENEANINAKSSGGWTPLLIAYKNGYMSIVKTLLEKEADHSDIRLLKKAEETHLIKNAIVKGIIVGFVVAAVVATALTFATTLSVPTMIRLVAGSALIASTVVGAGIYMMSKPKTEMGIDKNAERVALENMRKTPA